MKNMKSFAILSTLLAVALCWGTAHAAPSDFQEVPSQAPGYQQTPSIPGGLIDAATCGDGFVNGQENCDEGSGGQWDVLGGSTVCGNGFACAAPGTLDECRCYRNEVCGDGHITTPGEECDTAADPTGCAGNESCIQCQCISPLSACGDGVKAPNEECDPNADPTGCGTFEHCTNQCACKIWDLIEVTPPVCGNGVVEGPEECDGSASGCTQSIWPASCNPDCTCKYDKPTFKNPVCGDGTLDPGEECGEPGGPTGALLKCVAPQFCSNCKCLTPMPVCGNGIVESGEQCDGMQSLCLGAGATCDNCQCVYDPIGLVKCGDGKLSSTEECDPGIPKPDPGSCKGADICNQSCECEPPAGGLCVADGQLAPSEMCDPMIPKPNPGSCKGTDTCNQFCQCETPITALCVADGQLAPSEMCDPMIPKPNPGSCKGAAVCNQSCKCMPPVMSECFADGIFDPAAEACDPLIPVGDPGSCPPGQQCNKQCKCEPDVQLTCNPNGVLEASEACDPQIAFPNLGSCQAGSTCNQSCKCEPTAGCVADGFHNVPDEQCDFHQSGLVWGTQAYADEMVKQCENESGMTLPAGASWDACEMSECKCTYTLPQCVMGQPGVECDQQPPGGQCPIAGSACSLNCQCIPPPPPSNVCGNTVVEAGEQCDPPGSACAGGTCSQNCQCVGGGGGPVCGDGVVAIGQEECEPGVVWCLGQTVCDPSDCLCKFPPVASCGDGVVTPGLEQCDYAAPQTGCAPTFVCNQGCHCVTSVTFQLCGNGYLSQGEECDFAASDPLSSCTAADDPIACAQDCTCTYETRPTIPTDPSQVENVLGAPTDDCFVYTSSFSSDAAKEIIDGLNVGFRQATLRTDDRFAEPEQWVTIYCRFSRAAAPAALLSEGLALELSGTALPDSSDNLRPYMFVLESGSKPLPIGEFATFESVSEPLMILPITDTPAAQFVKAAILPELSASSTLSQLTPFLPSSVESAGGLKVLNGVIEHQAYAVVPGESYSIQLPEGGSVQLDAIADEGAPAGTASVVHVMRMQLEPGGTPFTAVEGYEERKPIEELQLDAVSDIEMLAARRQGETPLTSNQLTTDAWQKNLNYRGLFIQSQYVAKGQTMTEPEQRSFTALGMMPMATGQGGGCNCRLGQSNRIEGTLVQFILGAFILLVAASGIRRRAKRAVARKVRRR